MVNVLKSGFGGGEGGGVLVLRLGQVIVLCSLAKHFTFTESQSLHP